MWGRGDLRRIKGKENTIKTHGIHIRFSGNKKKKKKRIVEDGCV